MIRLATAADVPAMLDIYAPYVAETAISFEYEAPTLEEFMGRFRTFTERFPWIVWEEEGEVIGYAYASAAFERRAYAWDADLSIYLRRDARRRGIGGKMYRCMEALLARLNIHNLYALVTGGNSVSLAFHEKMGYELLGTLPDTGWKLGRWHAVYWLGKRLRAAADPVAFPDAFVCDEVALKIMADASEGR